MKIVVPGGTGQVGQVLTRALRSRGHEVCLIGRSSSSHEKIFVWDGKNLESWGKIVDGADVVINLAGRSVNCRYTKNNLEEMMNSRVDSTRVVGQAISQSKNPPRVWLQASTATIYAHRFDADNDEADGIIGGREPRVPGYWKYSIDIAQAWEQAMHEANTPHTRKIAMRSAMIMSPDENGIFDSLLRLVRWRLGGTVASGNQYISWVHEHDFVRAVEFLIAKDDISGAVNIAAPNPMAQKDFMKVLRNAWGVKIGLPATKLMAEIGAFFLRTDTELLFKSRRVISGKLQKAGFSFEFPKWPEAAKELVNRWRAENS
ncbi:MAG: TIGR01777 family oxidoreductase [Nitrososphaerales archaeon]